MGTYAINKKPISCAISFILELINNKLDNLLTKTLGRLLHGKDDDADMLLELTFELRKITEDR